MKQGSLESVFTHSVELLYVVTECVHIVMQVVDGLYVNCRYTLSAASAKLLFLLIVGGIVFNFVLICVSFTLFFSGVNLCLICLIKNANVNIVLFLCLTFEHNAESAAYKLSFVFIFCRNWHF